MFQFQQFSLTQENSAMKVGTDGVLLGAWTPGGEMTTKVLDVGTGTGLVALMLAQRFRSAAIHALEVDLPSCEDARLNFEASPWKDRLTLFDDSFQSFAGSTFHNYDLIVCNPPYFSGSIKNSCRRKAAARHNHLLPQDELLDGCSKILRQNGRFSIILPFSDYEFFRVLAARKGWYEFRRLKVRPTPHKPLKRVVSLWGKELPGSSLSEELVIELTRHQYSVAFQELTGDFYLE